MNTTLNTALKTRIATASCAMLASVLITFTGLHMIAGYALPGQAQSGAVQMAAALPTR